MKIIRHGDVIVEKVEKIPESKSCGERKELAFGEVTGHAHRVDVGELFETKEGQLYLKVDTLAKLSHEEHKTMTLDPGCYKITIKRQYIPNGWTNVAD
jgi:hypothetical protein